MIANYSIVASNALIVLLIFVHVSAVAAWVGGALFYEFIFTRKVVTLAPGSANEFTISAGKLITNIASLSLFLISISGLLLAYDEGGLNYSLFVSERGWFLLVSILLTALAITNGFLITMRYIPQLGSKIRAVSASKRIAFLARINTATALSAIVFMAIYAELISLTSV